MSGFLQAGRGKQRGQNDKGRRAGDAVTSRRFHCSSTRETPLMATTPALCSMSTVLRTRAPNKPEIPGPPRPRPPSSHLPAAPFPGRAVPPPTAGARSPARLGPLGVQHELAEAAPEGAACEQHRAQLHEQLQ